MLLGVDIPGVQHVVMVRPPNLPHAVVQGMGRAGRLLANGERQFSMVTVLYNAQDLSVKGMSEEIKLFCRTKDHCLKEVLRACFVGKYSVDLSPGSTNSCCSVCDHLMANSV